jgi:hypothetical protein
MTMTAKNHIVDVEQWLDGLEVDPANARDGRNMRRIGAAVAALELAQTELHAAVAAAREAGDTWAMIGTALGTTRQAAFQRFGQTAVTDPASGRVTIDPDLDRPRPPRKFVAVNKPAGQPMPKRAAKKKAAPRKQPPRTAAAAKSHKPRKG